jgi:hypothetical protein
MPETHNHVTPLAGTKPGPGAPCATSAVSFIRGEARAYSNRRKPGPGLVPAIASLIAMVLATTAFGQTVPRPLPGPQFPISELQLQPGPGYAGPPPAIDGPERLPAPELEVLPAPGIGPEELVPFRDDPLGGLMVEDELMVEEELFVGPQKLSPYKSGFFQKLSLSAAWFGNSNDPEDLGGTEIETFLTVALPCPIKEWPLLITPYYAMILLDAPGTDLPPQLHTAYLDFMWVPQFVHRHSLVLSVAPSVYSDFRGNHDDEFRLTGKALYLFDWVPERLQFVVGVLYLNRENINLLPAGGFIWSPTEFLRYELIFPKPKLAARFNVGPGFEDWVFTTAEFGGNTWSIVRESGQDDLATYLDYRILLGVERKLEGGAGYRLEVGYVFGREVEFKSGDGNFEPKDTILIRGGIMF